ncbi:MAG TPA: hypothetical protein VFC10_00530 [Terriglobia bacterium]|nr:hypothetical protein [Terriglobia bacterium]
MPYQRKKLLDAIFAWNGIMEFSSTRTFQAIIYKTGNTLQKNIPGLGPCFRLPTNIARAGDTETGRSVFAAFNKLSGNA